MTSLLNLIRGSVDYAGLFPPAGLPMQQVVDNYASYRECPCQAMLGRLIIPASQLADFETYAADYLSATHDQPGWAISALVPPLNNESGEIDSADFDSGLESIRSFNDKLDQKNPGRCRVDAIEVKTSTAALIEATVERVPPELRPFCELPHQSDPEELVKCLAGSAQGQASFAKIRTGGVTPDLIPTISEVARFIATCARHDVGFKATAGLHHPIRAEHQLTYESDSPSAITHGFLNVFVAALIAFEHNVEQTVIEEILANTAPSRFDFQSEKLTWDQWEVRSEQITKGRNHGIISFGSCSFVEPTEELQQLAGDAYQTVFAG